MRARLIRWLLRACALAPLPLVHALGAGIGWLLALLPNEARRITFVNLDLCFPQSPPRTRARLARRSLIETAKTALELGPLWYWERRKVLRLVRKVSGGEHLEAAIAHGKGVIVASPHLGAWELAGLYVSTLHPLTSLYRPPRMTALDAPMRTARERFGARLVPTDASGIRALYQALAHGEAIGILPDQEPGAGTGTFAPFFGVAANTMVLLARLAHRYQSPVVFVYAERLPYGRGFHMRFLPAPPALGEAEPDAAVQAMNAMVEQCVRACPEQYQWSYKRFRTRPAGEPRIY